jgi:mono/diheme cytochrome c family protein
MIRDAILSGLRGREIELLETLLTTGSKTARPDVLAALSGAVIIERKSANVKRLLALTAAQSGDARLALLEGASGKNTPKGARKPKLLYLDAEPSEMATLATASTDAKSKPLFAGLDSLIAWPGKPGVPPPPVIPALNPEQQRLFDIGKVTYNTLCTGCHQPSGMGMDGLAPTLVDSDWVLGNPAILQRVVLHGLTGPIKVNNQNWSLEMPPLGAALTDDQVAGVLTYIRREWEHGASPVSVADVQKTREENKERAKAWTIEDFIQVGLIKKDVKK